MTTHFESGRRAWLGQLGALALVASGCKRTGVDEDPLDPHEFADPAAAMRWMREEEKLARDVYLTLSERFPGVHQFTNIARSEQRHMDAMRGLLAGADEADPVEDDAVGAFHEPQLGALFEALVAAGERSEVDALRVGAELEELDIADLDRALVGNPDPSAQSVYALLRQGSCNHLNAFTRGLAQRGHEYAPQHLERAAYEAALARATNGRGHGRGHGHGG